MIELRKVGVFASALIKKRRYWPRYVPGDAINEKMKDKKVGECDSLKGVLGGQNYDIFCLKEPDYVMKVMSTYGGLVVKSGQEDSKRTWMEGDEEKTACFKYMEPFANHFDYRHLVDDHNLLRHMVPSIEETWTTDRWANRVFAYLLATSEINSYLAMKHWLWRDEKETVHYHRKQLALELINWAKDHEEDDIDESGCVTTRKKRTKVEHEYLSAPPFAKMWDGRRWICEAKNRYQQYVCKTPRCKAQVRAYCVCSPAVWRCRICYDVHLVDEASRV